MRIGREGEERRTSSRMSVVLISRASSTSCLSSSSWMTWPVGLRGFDAMMTSRPCVLMSFCGLFSRLVPADADNKDAHARLLDVQAVLVLCLGSACWM